MKNIGFIYLVFASALIIVCGCVKTGTREIMMPDQDISGNQGYMKGVPEIGSDRQIRKKIIYELEIEVPDMFKKEPGSGYKDETIWGNQGYLYKRDSSAVYIYTSSEKVQERVSPEPVKQQPEAVLPDKDARQCEVNQSGYIEYKVSSGESLWSISKKIYGDAAKWNIIYEHNRDVIKDSHNLNPGMILKVPVQEDSLKYIK
ncbi:MAG: LysM peptidoglycan-binding domain-containing protein [Candidatus Omnitrophica bacterium]|nr:LysM peptidoglycan-binding domain-containing protein [Candidatus Omnitrophota bacterium]